MINENFTLTRKTNSTTTLTWLSANAADVSYVSINGVMLYAPLYFTTVNRQIDIAQLVTDSKAITIQDFEVAEGGIVPVEIFENERPTVLFQSVASAISYKIYHTPFGGVEALIFNRRIAVKGIITIQIPIALVEGWHFFRVEAVDLNGNESTRLEWRYRCFKLPEPVQTIDVVDGSGGGLFDISIT